VDSKILVEFFNKEMIDTFQVFDRIEQCRMDLEQIERGVDDLERVATEMNKSDAKKSASDADEALSKLRWDLMAVKTSMRIAFPDMADEIEREFDNALDCLNNAQELMLRSKEYR